MSPWLIAYLAIGLVTGVTVAALTLHTDNKTLKPWDDKDYVTAGGFGIFAFAGWPLVWLGAVLAILGSAVINLIERNR